MGVWGGNGGFHSKKGRFQGGEGGHEKKSYLGEVGACIGG